MGGQAASQGSVGRRFVDIGGAIAILITVFLFGYWVAEKRFEQRQRLENMELRQQLQAETPPVVRYEPRPSPTASQVVDYDVELATGAEFTFYDQQLRLKGLRTKVDPNTQRWQLALRAETDGHQVEGSDLIPGETLQVGPYELRIAAVGPVQVRLSIGRLSA